MNKLYEKDIIIEVRPGEGLFGKKWLAITDFIERPYQKPFATRKTLYTYAKTADKAVEKLKNELCKITAREEERHSQKLQNVAGIKETSFNREQDCCSVKPRPRPFV